MADHTLKTVSLELAAELIDTSELIDTKLGKALERLHSKMFAVNHNTGGENYHDVAQLYFTLPDQFLLKITIANFFQNEPQNIPPSVLDVLGQTFE